ncbi:hypothetical protein GCM10009647_044960 [Streptomyces sanglieri]
MRRPHYHRGHSAVVSKLPSSLGVTPDSESGLGTGMTPTPALTNQTTEATPCPSDGTEGKAFSRRAGSDGERACEANPRIGNGAAMTSTSSLHPPHVLGSFRAAR